MPKASSTVVRHIEFIRLYNLSVRNTHYLHLGDTSALFQVDDLIVFITEVEVEAVDVSAKVINFLLITTGKTWDIQNIGC